MDLAQEADPPAYQAVAPTSATRSIEDTRALILANASIIKSRTKTDGPVELVIGKTRAPAPVVPSGSRSFTSTTSNVTIRVNDTERSASSSNSPERRASPSRPERIGGRHYAALVSRHNFKCNDIDMIMLGEPQDSVEQALEWMLDRTEIVITDMLSRHRKQATAACCLSCSQVLT